MNLSLKTKKLISICLFISLASCTKAPLQEEGEYYLYNDPTLSTTMVVGAQQVDFYRHDTLFASRAYSGDLLKEPFIMPAGIWGNAECKGEWSYRAYYLQFLYTAENRDTSLLEYIPTETYMMDWVKY